MGKARTKKSKTNGNISIKRLDDLWAKVVKCRARGRCEYCGKTTTLNSHHIFSRSNKTTRWDVNNGICLCVAHHVFSNMSAHKAPIEFVEWLKEKRGEQWYEELRQRAKSVVRKIDKQQIREELEQLL
jgi:hypothetical protein